MIRHGPPIMPSDRIRVKQFPDWLRAYGEADADLAEPVPERTRRMVEGARFIASSNAKCAVQSTASLTNSLSFLQSSLFREAALLQTPPLPRWVSMKPESWVRVGRACWLAGLGRSEEPYEQARIRARQAADVLIGYAAFYQKVALVGHSYFNVMVAKELQQRGWLGPLLPERGYWNCAVYRYNKVLAGTDLKQHVPLTFP
ncbi:histidine phosphatase family protein [Ectobacillus ponti]|uniref:Histidine phosphatase family protein n=1 Tax=Ectobacillus ponti TaxID=2961894 RepID=A0AA41X3Y9_9BACI|nr:histidine phosphatase family protein [Ectobacillus ponti]MCP8968534.1 histidine phosphatase family protein [Ectobacillus ponti]